MQYVFTKSKSDPWIIEYYNLNGNPITEDCQWSW